MSNTVELKSDRLLLRQWKPEDYPLFADLNADPDVMEFFPTRLNQKASNHLADKLTSIITDNSWGFWALELIKTKQFIGLVGLNQPQYLLPVSPCVEIGWRLAKQYWGNGYATEAALIALKFAFKELNLNQIYSFTSVLNKRSSSVMERLNMKNTDANFDHPLVPLGHPHREHVLYKITKEQYNQN